MGVLFGAISSGFCTRKWKAGLKLYRFIGPINYLLMADSVLSIFFIYLLRGTWWNEYDLMKLCKILNVLDLTKTHIFFLAFYFVLLYFPPKKRLYSTDDDIGQGIHYGKLVSYIKYSGNGFTCCLFFVHVLNCKNDLSQNK